MFAVEKRFFTTPEDSRTRQGSLYKLWKFMACLHLTNSVTIMDMQSCKRNIKSLKSEERKDIIRQ